MKTRRRGRRGLGGLAAGLAVAGLVGTAGIAHADPPSALPGSAPEADQRFMPAFDYDNDGCYPTPAIGPDGTVNPGLDLTGTLDGRCHDAADLDNTNSYSRSTCDNGWCVYLYGLYFEKDKRSNTSEDSGHTHDWEHVAVWTQNNTVRYVSVSQHGNYEIKPANDVLFDGTHAKVVYHKDGDSTHAFRFARTTDEPPENHNRTWQRPTLVGWDNYPPGIRDRLTSHNFGGATFALKDSEFARDLAKARPRGISFPSWSEWCEMPRVRPRC